MNPIQEYQTYLAKVDITPTIDITSLATLRERASQIVVKDITNEAEMAVAKAMRKELSDARIEISKNAKIAREDFHKAWKGVIEVEKILLSEFTGEEDRLKDYEVQLKAKRLRDERMLVLPTRRERLGDIEATDEELLAMDDLTFSNFLATKQAEILAEQKRKEEEAARLEQAKKEAAEAATREAERKAEAEKQELLEKIEREATEKKRKEAEEEQRKADEAREAEKLAKQKKFKKFLEDNGYNEQEFMYADEGDKVVLYKKVAEYVK